MFMIRASLCGLAAVGSALAGHAPGDPSDPMALARAVRLVETALEVHGAEPRGVLSPRGVGAQAAAGEAAIQKGPSAPQEPLYAATS